MSVNKVSKIKSENTRKKGRYKREVPFTLDAQSKIFSAIKSSNLKLSFSCDDLHN